MFFINERWQDFAMSLFRFLPRFILARRPNSGLSRLFQVNLSQSYFSIKVSNGAAPHTLILNSKISK